MGNTKRNIEKEKFISTLMNNGYSLKEAQKEYLAHKQQLLEAQAVADLTGKSFIIVTEIVTKGK